ncbi:hypothetical protein [Mangrovibacillus cuniculi]|uniref:Uncharacterized protein n=1 Tax=Mangrovibacillus cuniculi TaxID=2593652 RepID=A0A7S8CAR7_9BACI|nr:hypothetical protein [Mangrovibacillus cuniculi]QPC46518.1 hypothetical protein G8O30_05825 [Mangrovibacillus cuniculi]
MKKLSSYSFFLLVAMSCLLFLYIKTSIVLFLWATYEVLLSNSVFFILTKHLAQEIKRKSKVASTILLGMVFLF